MLQSGMSDQNALLSLQGRKECELVKLAVHGPADGAILCMETNKTHPNPTILEYRPDASDYEVTTSWFESNSELDFFFPTHSRLLLFLTNKF